MSWLSGYRRLYWAVPGGMSPCLSEHCSTIMSRSEHCAGPGYHFHHTKEPCTHVLWLIFRCSQLSSLCPLTLAVTEHIFTLLTVFIEFSLCSIVIKCVRSNFEEVKVLQLIDNTIFWIQKWGKVCCSSLRLRGNIISFYLYPKLQYIQYTFNTSLNKSPA